jgi:hypothetical protein
MAVCAAISARRPLPSLFVIADRTDDEPLSEGEWPAAIVKVLTVQMSHGPEQGQTMHDALIHIECQSGNTATNGIDATNQTTIADIIAAIHADRSLGGRVEDCEEDQSDASENAGVDVGAAVLLVRTRFYTPRGDLFTIVGVGGQLFT